MTAKITNRPLKKRGRPSEYLPKYADIVFSLKLRGCITNQEICKIFRISEKTLYKWAKQYPEFGKSLKETQESTLQPIVTNLYDRATKVFEYDEIKTFGVTDKDGNLKVSRVEKIHKKILPDVTAMIFLAKNIDKEHFRDSRYVDANVTTQEVGKVTVVQLPDNHRNDMEDKVEIQKIKKPSIPLPALIENDDESENRN